MEKYMKELKKEHRAWLVWHVVDQEEFGVTVDHFYIFTENEVLENFHRSDVESYKVFDWEEILDVRPSTGLHLEYPRIKELVKNLDIERAKKLEYVIEGLELEDKYNRLQEILEKRTKRLLEEE